MVGNNSGLMDLAKHFDLERWVIGQFNRGGKKLLPNVVESLIGVMQYLYGFDFVDAFLAPLFNDHAKNWFERYLPEGVKIDIVKSEKMAASSSTSTSTSSTDMGGLGFSPDLPLPQSNMSFRNELDEYLLRRRQLYPGCYGGDLRVHYEQTGEDNRTQWIARAQVELDGEEVLLQSAQGLSKKVAQNEACFLLLKDVKKYDASARTNTPSPYPPSYNRKRSHSDFSGGSSLAPSPSLSGSTRSTMGRLGSDFDNISMHPLPPPVHQYQQSQPAPSPSLYREPPPSPSLYREPPPSSSLYR
ncbi:hypothetical protein BC936DRAFT_144135, partial [Jimgerdemannia flammicorona]